jgi:predicted transcriptional regulator
MIEARYAIRTKRGSAVAILLLASACLWLPTTPCYAQSLQALLGKPAPFFSVQSGDDTTLTLDALKGKVSVIFYETRGASKKNSDTKDRFNKLYDRQSADTKQAIARVPVIDCSRVVWPMSLLWRQSLRYHSKRVGMTVYGDWDGRMARDYRMKEDESNLIILDKRGVVRYVSQGLISDEEFPSIEALLDRLVNREE